MKTVFSFALAILVSLNALAGQDRGGGDETALEFQQAFRAALQKIEQRYPDLAEKLAGLSEKAKSALVIVTETPLIVAHDGTRQVSVAVNEPGRNLIVLNRARWNGMSNSILREALALHEYASLLGLEDTGDYALSAEYVARHGRQADSLLHPDREEERQRAELQKRLDAARREEKAILREVPAIIAITKSLAFPWIRDTVKADRSLPVSAGAVLHRLVADLWKQGYTPGKVDAIIHLYRELYAGEKCQGYTPSGELVEADTPLCIARAVYFYKQRFPKGNPRGYPPPTTGRKTCS